MGDGDAVRGRLAGAEDDLGVALRDGAEVVDLGEWQLLDQPPQLVQPHAAASTAASSRYAAKIASASCIDSIWNSRSRSSAAPGTPFVYQPKCLRNSSAVRREAPLSRSATPAHSRATRHRSAPG